MSHYPPSPPGTLPQPTQPGTLRPAAARRPHHTSLTSSSLSTSVRGHRRFSSHRHHHHRHCCSSHCSSASTSSFPSYAPRALGIICPSSLNHRQDLPDFSGSGPVWGTHTPFPASSHLSAPPTTCTPASSFPLLTSTTLFPHPSSKLLFTPLPQTFLRIDRSPAYHLISLLDCLNAFASLSYITSDSRLSLITLSYQARRLLD